MRSGDVTHIIVHCTDSAFGDVALVDSWHKAKGWSGIGYHYLITGPHPKTTSRRAPGSDGTVHTGRALDKPGAHAVGFNARSIGVCIVGRGAQDFTAAQRTAALELCRDLMKRFNVPRENVLGHCETRGAKGKTCPNMPMDAFRASL